MPTSIPGTDPLGGLAAQLAGLPQADTPRGGMENSFRGVTIGPSGPSQTADPRALQDGITDPFAGMGPVLELPDDQVFKQTDGLVLRQELLAKNHLAQDSYYTCLVAGYPWATLTHDTTRDIYTFSLPYGAAQTTIQAVPNKNLDLINKMASSLLVDFAQADVEPLDDSDEAEAACEMATRFLAESASEVGTNDAVLFDDRVKRSLVTASAYIEGWVDPTAGGYVPLQINAHPEAVSPLDPLTDAQGNPTTDTVLRYVTGPINPDGTPGDGSQFTTDPSQAAPQWQPAIRASMWGREHVRVFPEDQPVHFADKVIILGYCTLGQAKKRWPTVQQMAPEDLTKLCDWQPQRYLVLLPPFQRARWMLTDGREKEKAGASDERLMFYYHIYQKATPDYPKGADVVVTGSFGGRILDKKLLAVDAPAAKALRADDPNVDAKETRCREIPVVQVTPRGDPNGRDPSGLAYLELFVGATEHNATLAMGYAEALDHGLHTPYTVPSTSPIEGWQVEEARKTGDMIVINRVEDKPTQIAVPVLPNGFFEMYNLSDEAINSISVQERAAQGSENSQERSGKALQIAISRNQVAATAMQQAVNNAIARWNRIKLELAMAEYTTAQLIKYEGEDGAYKVDEFTGTDFALIGRVSVRAGTGTGMDPVAKVNYLAQLGANQMLSADEVADAARPAFSKSLGLPDNPHEQYVERCVEAWDDGPPDLQQGDPSKPTWAQQYQQWKQAETVYQQAVQQFNQATADFQQFQQMTAIVNAGAPPIALGPQVQYDAAAVQHAAAVEWLMQHPMAGVQPVPPPPNPVPKPWTPFKPRPNDTEPQVASIWLRKLSKAMSSVRYDAYGPEWQDVLDQQYITVRQAVASVSTPQAQPGAPQPSTAQPQRAQPSGPATHQQSPAQSQHPTHSTPAPRAHAA